MLGLANSNMDVGFAGWVPAMIARTIGHPDLRRRAQRGREHEPGDQLAEHPRQGIELDPHAGRPRRQDDRRQRPEGRRRGDDPGGAREERRRPELDQAPRAAVPGDAGGAQQRTGRRDLDARAVPVAGDHDRRRPRSDAPGPVLGDYWPIGGYFVRTDWAAKNPGLAGEVPDGDEPVARVLAEPPGRDPRPAARGVAATSGCRSGRP